MKWMKAYLPGQMQEECIKQKLCIVGIQESHTCGTHLDERRLALDRGQVEEREEIVAADRQPVQPAHCDGKCRKSSLAIEQQGQTCSSSGSQKHSQRRARAPEA